MSSSPTVSSSAASLPVVQAQALGPLWPTMDPFLFCAHHDDAYPPSDGQLGVRAAELVASAAKK